MRDVSGIGAHFGLEVGAKQARWQEHPWNGGNIPGLAGTSAQQQLHAEQTPGEVFHGKHFLWGVLEIRLGLEPIPG